MTSHQHEPCQILIILFFQSPVRRQRRQAEPTPREISPHIGKSRLLVVA